MGRGIRQLLRIPDQVSPPYQHERYGIYHRLEGCRRYIHQGVAQGSEFHAQRDAFAYANSLQQNSTVGNFLYLADYDDNRKIRHVGSHLGCFVGGNWILGAPPFF